MQLNITTDYAIRALFYLAMEKHPVGGSEISEKMNIPHSYLLTIMGKLKKAGFVSAARGHIGGYYLVKEPEAISMWDIISVMEGTTQVNRCLEDDQYCSRLAVDICPIRQAYGTVQKNMEETFKNVTLKQLVEQQN
jgi:Rrf2 family nitric oxide-sensitive transcriptional repressor